jgi:serine protease Do
MKSAFSKVFFSLGLATFMASFLVVTVGHAEFRILDLWGGAASSSSSIASTTNQQVRVVSQQDQVVETVKRASPAVASVIISKERTSQRTNTTVQREVGGGTAFFVSSDGLLMTNKHVVADEGAQYTVVLSDGRKLSATVVGLDGSDDIALLRVQGTNFPALSIATSDTVDLGQTTIAIGNALGEFGNTVSVGVVSGVERSIVAGGFLSGSAERLDQIIQTDAAINEGNSGGPLLDIFGNVIGMNSAVAGGDAQNIGFALPAKELRRVLSNFQKNGRIVQTYLGIRYTQVTADTKDELGLTQDYGVLLSPGETPDDAAILPGSPAEKAGLKDGDVILEADGKKITEAVSLQQIIVNKNPGDTLALKVFRGGRTLDIVATLAEMK